MPPYIPGQRVVAAGGEDDETAAGLTLAGPFAGLQASDETPGEVAIAARPGESDGEKEGDEADPEESDTDEQDSDPFDPEDHQPVPIPDPSPDGPIPGSGGDDEDPLLAPDDPRRDRIPQPV